jgi:competence protein ComEA
MIQRWLAAVVAYGAAAAWIAVPGAQTQKADWLTDGGDPQRTAWQRTETIRTKDNVKDLGMEASEDELTQILDYFSDKFKGEASRPININSATSVELESVVSLLRKEAAAWIAYRMKNGPCKTLEDLKKVPGIPFKKIEERRDRLVCF